MDMEKLFYQMVIFTKETMLMGNDMGREHTYFEMEPNTRVFMMREKRVAMEYLSTLMDLNMRASGKMTNVTVKACTFT